MDDLISISPVLSGRLSKSLPQKLKQAPKKLKIAELGYFPHFLA